MHAFDPRTFLATVGHGRTVTTYHKNGVIFRQESPADAVYYLQTGSVKMVVTSKHGKNAVIAIHRPGAFFGEGCLIGQAVRSATAKVMSEARVMRLGKAAMLRVLHEPAFAQIFITHLLTRASRIEEDLVDQLFNSTEKRLGRTLLLLVNPGDAREPQPVATRITQGTLAEIVGTTRPRISHFMNKFRKLGLISYGNHGHLQVHRPLLSAILHD